MGNCTGIRYKFFSGSWSGWNTTLKGGYAGWKGSGSNRVVVLQFKTPAKSSSDDGYYNSKVVMKIPFLEDQGGDTIYAKCQTSDPTYDQGEMTICAIPTASTATASYTFSGGNSQYRTATFTIKDLKPSTLYYVILGTKGSCGSNVQIGPGNDSHKYDFNFTYTGYTNGSKPSTPIITDSKENTATISGKQGKNGDNNTIKKSYIYYTTDKSSPTSSGTRTKIDLTKESGGSYSKTINIPTDCKEIKAVTYSEFNYGSKQNSDTGSSTVKFRYGPLPQNVKINWTKSRLTVRESLTITWDKPAEDTTNYLPVSCLKGYRIRLYKNGSEVKLTTSSTHNWFDTREDPKGTTLLNGATYKNTAPHTITFDPKKFGFKAGDTIQARVHAAYEDARGYSLWSGSKDGTPTDSVKHTIQNAGVVHVNTSTTSTPNFVEGIVYVYTGTGSAYDASKWVEAELVQVCTDGVNKKWTDAI